MSTLSEVKITTEPTVEPLTTAEFHTFAEIDTGYTDHDAAIIPNAIKSARQIVERYLNRALITQTITAYYSATTDKVYLPYGPIQSVTTVTTYRLNNTNVLTLNTGYYVQGNHDKYLFMTNPVDVTPGMSPRDSLKAFELEVVYVAGYGDASTDIPQDIINCVGMVAQAIYERQTTDIPDIEILNDQVKQMLNPYRNYTI